MAIERKINPETQLGTGQTNFVRHWKELRSPEHLAPTVVRWIEALTGYMAVHTYRLEVHDDDCLLIFAGSWLMAKDITSKAGESVYVRFPTRKAVGLANIRTVVHHPCGYCLSMWVKSAGAFRQSVLLPLEVPPGRHLQAIGFVDYVGRPSSAVLSDQPDHRWWIDVGAGIPAVAPQEG